MSFIRYWENTAVRVAAVEDDGEGWDPVRKLVPESDKCQISLFEYKRQVGDSPAGFRDGGGLSLGEEGVTFRLVYLFE